MSLHFEAGYYDHQPGVYQLNEQTGVYDYHVQIAREVRDNDNHQNSYSDGRVDKSGYPGFAGLCFTCQTGDDLLSKPVDRSQVIHIFTLYD